MPFARVPVFIGLVSCLPGALLLASEAPKTDATNVPPQYEVRAEHDPDGIGKFYLGREIAHVMGHQAADWLERPEREIEERPDLLLEALHIKPGQSVADIGAGSGYFTRRLARLVGEKGTVYAVDIQPEMLDLLTNKMAELKIGNVKPILGDVADPHLPPSSVDLILMVDVYHEFDHPYEMVRQMIPSLRPGGRLIFVEFRGEDPKVPIKRVHKMTEAQLRRELAVHPLQWVEAIEVLPRQHIFTARKPKN
jgi:ubiquinone/menaquinone biosynthesis C-methylase UbiE